MQNLHGCPLSARVLGGSGGVGGWSDSFNISKHNTHLYCGTSVTHPNTHTGALSTNE